MTPRILIVEDEVIVAMEIQLRLESLGYEVSETVASGPEAIQQVAQTSPDLILMDIRLRGDMDGIEAAQKIRQSFNVPIVYLTAYANQDIWERAKLTEPFGYLLKPFQERDLQITIEMALYKHKMERELHEKKQWLTTTLKSIGDGVIATDDKGEIVFMNPVAESLTGWPQVEAIGQELAVIFNIVKEETGRHIENPAIKTIKAKTTTRLPEHTLLITKDRTEIPIADSVAPITDGQGNILGTVLVFQDITERRRTEAEREHLISELQEALDTIETLSGIIPICSNCKKIRDEEGAWSPLEVYMSQHSKADFSHSICPECMANLYSEYMDDL